MAPETTANTPETTSQTLAVPAPAAGETVAVRSAAGAELILGFNPSEAIVSRDGNSLVFELDNGGVVTLVDFFAVGDEPLPDFRLPDGVLVSSLDFFAGSDIDVSTAAGPGGTAPSSGLGAYDGDPGAFTDGIDRLSDQGTFYWGRDYEVDREDQGYGLAGGAFGMNAVTFGQVLAYEDARPFQHLDTPPQGQVDFNPARLEFLPEPLPGNSVNEVRISGLPAGARLYTLDPQTGEYELIDQPADGIYRFQEADFLDPAGVYIAPPANSDDEFTLDVGVDFNYNGLISTVTGNVTVFVDAVADRAEEVATDHVYDPADAAYEGGTSGKIAVEATFGDYLDSSESHYLVIYRGEAVEGVDGASLPDGLTLLEGPAAADFAANTGISGDYWVIEVSADYLQAHDGVVNETVGVTVRDYASDQTGLRVDTEAVAVEYQGYNTVTSPNEAYAVNNVSRVPGQAEVNVSVISSDIEVGVSSPAYEDSLAEAHVGDLTPHVGAQIDISGLAAGDNESVTEITFTFNCQQDAASGEYVGGSFWYKGVEYPVTDIAADGTGSLTLPFPASGAGAFDQSLPIYYRPGQSDSDADINLNYAVTVHDANLSAAHDKVFQSEAPLLLKVDAVADQARNVDTREVYEAGANSYVGGEAGEISLQANFGDYHDGTESHYLVIYKGGAVEGVDGASLPDGLTLLEGPAAADFAANSGISDECWVIEVSADYLQAHDGVVNETVGVTVRDYASDQTGLTVDTEAVAIEHSGLNTVSGQGGADGETRADNNVARVPGQAEVNVSVISSDIEVGVSSPAYEDSLAEAHAGDLTPHAGAQIDISGLAAGDNESVTEITFTFNCQQDAASGEYVGGSFWYKGVEYPVTDIAPDGTGSLTLPFPASGAGAFDQNEPLYYRPGQSDSDADINLNYAVTVHDANLSAAHDKVFQSDVPLLLKVDAVADQAGGVDTREVYEAGANSYVGGEAGEISLQANFGDYHDGTESHYLVIYKGEAVEGVDGASLPDGLTLLEGPAAADFAANTGISDECWVIEVSDQYLKDHNGKVDLTVEAEINGGFVSDQSGLKINTAAVSMEHQGLNTPLDGSGGVDGETRADNNVAIVDREISVNVGAIRSDLSLSADAAVEDNRPLSYQGNDLTLGSGAAITVAGLASGDNESITEAVFTFMAPQSYNADGSVSYEPGVFTYDGSPVSLTGPGANGLCSFAIANLDPDKPLVYTPGQSHSDVDFDLSYRITVNDTKLGDKVFEGAVGIEVDSVADQASLGSIAIEPDLEDGRYVVKAADGLAETTENASGETVNTGWFVSQADNTTPIACSVDLSAAFADLDGSESAMVLVELSAGISVPGAETWVDPASGKHYAIIAQGSVDQLGAGADSFTSGKFGIDLEIGPEANLKDLNVAVRTQENNAEGSYNQTANDVSWNETGDKVNLAWLQDSVSVKTGWVYEDGDGGKYKAGAHAFAGYDGYDAGSTSSIGAPVTITVSDQVTQVTISFNPDEGTFYLKGQQLPNAAFEPDPSNPDNVILVINKDAFDNLDKLTFKPSATASRSDADIQLDYTIKAENNTGDQFVIKGSTSVVVDAVADLATDVKAASGVGNADDSVIISVSAHFPDADPSEAHYILVEAREGWLVEGGALVSVMVDASGNPAYPTGHDSGGYTWPAGSVAKEFYRVEAQEGANDLTLSRDPAWQGEYGDFTVKTVVVSQERVVAGPGNHEYDYSNNFAYVANDVKVDLIDSKASLKAQSAYEDHRPTGHLATGQNQVLVNNLLVALAQAGGSGEKLDLTEGNAITITFQYEGDQALLQSGADGATFTVGNYTTPKGAITGPDGNGFYSVEIPASAAGSGDIASVNIRYNPPTNDDSDLTGVKVTVPVVSGNGQTGSLSTNAANLVVDAVADLTSHTVARGDITSADPADSKTYEAISWGSSVEIAVTGVFGDLDGSENHYVLVERPSAGWTCADADGVISVNGKDYFYKEVDAGNDGLGEHTFTLTAPDKQAGGLSDGTIKIGTGSMAVEGEIVAGADGKGAYSYVDKDGNQLVADPASPDYNEARTDNNVSFTPGGTSVDVLVNVVGGAVGGAYLAWEDHASGQHFGDNVQRALSGRISISLGDRTGENVESGLISFTYGDGSASDVPGNFTYYRADGSLATDSGGKPLVLEPVYNTASGKWEVNINAAITNDAANANGGDVQLRYNPPANDSTDLGSFTYELTVSSVNSGETATVTGSINTNRSDPNYGINNGTGRLVVDAAADKPADVRAGVEYAETGQPGRYTAVESGRTVTVEASVTFGDFSDNSELHYVAVQRGGVPYTTECYVTGSTTLGDLGKQVITVTAENGAYQVIDFQGRGSGASTLKVYDKNGALVHEETLSVAQANAIAGDGIANGTHQYLVPVSNELLQAGESGTVSVDIQVTAPNFGMDATLRPNVGGYAVDADSDSSSGYANNTAYAGTRVEIEVHQVTSDLTISLESGRVYENGKPLNYLNAQDEANQDTVGGFKFSDLKKGEYAEHEFAAGVRAAGAEMTIGGLHGGEQAVITFSMTVNGAAPEGGDWGKLYLIGGNGAVKELGEFRYDPASGKITCTVTVDGLDSPGFADGDQSLYFVPGENYNSNNITLDWKASVTDTASGAHNDTFESGTAKNPSLGVVVDAVANAGELKAIQVDSDMRGAGELESEGYSFYGQGHGKLNLAVSVNFADFDGSEKHFVLVEIAQGASLSAEFTSAFPGVDFTDSNNIHYEFDAAGNVTAAYYRIPVDGYEDNGYVTVTGTGDERTVTVKVEMDIEGGNGSSLSIGSGAMTIEYDRDSQIGGYYDQAGNLVTEEQSESKINDKSVVINDPIQVTISEASVTGNAGKVVVSEDGRPEAHTQGNTGAQQSVSLHPSFAAGSDDAITEVRISWNSADDGRGSITYTDGGGNVLAVANGGSVPYEYLGSLKYTPASGQYDDSDISIRYVVTVKDANSGDVQQAAIDQKIVFDAVAQKPVVQDVIVDTTDGKLHQVFSHDNERVHTKVEMSVQFTDVTDGSTSHYVLIECKAGWDVEYPVGEAGSGLVSKVQAPDGVWYFKVDVTDQVVPGANDTGVAKVEVDLVAPAKVYGDRWFNSDTGEVSLAAQNGEGWVKLPGNDSGSLSYGGLSHDRTSGDEEARWDNNWAFDVSGAIEAGYNHDCPGGWEIEAYAPAFENDAPLAHLGNSQTMGGAVISFLGGAAGEKPYTYNYDENSGRLEVRDAAGQVVMTVGDGDTYALKDGENLYFVPAKNGSDADVQVSVSGPDVPGRSTSFWVTVDAVAQAPNVDSAAALGHTWTDGKIYTDESVQVVVKGSVEDFDGSEEHFILIAQNQVPAIEIPGAALIMVYSQGAGGESVSTPYYKIPVSVDQNGNYETTVDLLAKGGEGEYKLAYGVGSIEQPTDGEVWSENNTAIKIEDKTIDFNVALVNTTAGVTPLVEALENTEAANLVAYSTNLVVRVGDHDTVDSITIKLAPAMGELALKLPDGSVVTLELAEGKVLIDGADSGLSLDNGGLTIASDTPGFGSLFQALDNASSDSSKTVNVELSYTPALYENQDVAISAGVTAHDVRSLDDGAGGGSNLTEVDAVAARPRVVDLDGDPANANTGAYLAEHQSAQVGEEVLVKMAVTFADIDPGKTDATPEYHYVLVESKANWGYPEGADFAKTYDQNGVEFYKVPVDDALRACYADAAAANSQVGKYTDSLGIAYTVTFNADGTVTVEAAMHLTLPELQLKGDYTYELKYGGQSVDTPYADSNASIHNDVNFNTTGKVSIDVGVVEAVPGDVGARIVAADENQRGESNAVEISFSADMTGRGTNDVVETVYIKAGDVKNGVLLVDGVPAVPNQNGQYVISGDAAVTFKPNEYWSGEYDIAFTATVVDGKSGAGNGLEYTGKFRIDVDPVATAPENISAADPAKAVGSYSTVTFTAQATFPDSTGEQHYLLVEARDGWSGGYTPITHEGVKYFMVPVNNATLNPSVNVTLMTPRGLTSDADIDLKVGALSREGGQDNFVFENGDNDSVTVRIGVVEATAVTLEADGVIQEDGRANLRFDVVGDHNDSLTRLTITLPAGGKIVDADGAVIYQNPYSSSEYTVGITNPAHLAGLQNGAYYYQPKGNVSGEHPLKYSATVTDDASSVSKTLNGTETVKITGLTDAAASASHSTSAPSIQAGHSQNMTLTLRAAYEDVDGSEDHFFLVKLPTGVTPVGAGWAEASSDLKLAAGFLAADKVYRFDMSDSSTSVSKSITVKVPENFDGKIEYAAGSREMDGSDGYKFTGGQAGLTTGEINIAPDIVNGSVNVTDTLRNPELGASGKISLSGGTVGATQMTDKDGDIVTVTRLTSGNASGNAAVDNGDTLVIEGQYGYLTINKLNGSYSYELKENVNPANAARDVFDVSVSDTGYSGQSAVDQARITINLYAPNAAPTANGVLTIAAGGLPEDQLALITGNMGLTDTNKDAGGQRDAITITQVAGVTEAGQGYFEVRGDYGVLRVYADGKYDYQLTDQFASGKETFKVNFQDAYGGANSATITVNVAPVWHAPVVGVMENSFDGSGGYIMGNLAYSDPDGDRLTVTIKGADGQDYTMPASGAVHIPTEHGTLTLFADGSYSYSAAGGTGAAGKDVWDSIGVTVTDGRGLSDSGLLNVALGHPADPAPALVDAGGPATGILGDANAAGSQSLTGTEASETIYGGSSNDILNGGGGNDILYGGAGNDAIYGGGGHDAIEGGAGNDTIYGGSGNDVIYGGAGNDIMSAGSGDDIFIWKPGEAGPGAGGAPFHDIIVDFSMQGAGIENGLLGNDKINLSELLPKNANVADHVSISQSDDGKSAILSVSASANGEVVQTIELLGVYETYSANNDYEAVNAMIMQHIITNS